jgi:hypothetical protein
LCGVRLLKFSMKFSTKKRCKASLPGAQGQYFLLSLRFPISASVYVKYLVPYIKTISCPCEFLSGPSGKSFDAFNR